MRRVFVCSPFRGEAAGSKFSYKEYLIAALEDCIRREEAPFAAHAIYPMVLNDSDPKGRKMGIAAGIEWLKVSDAVVVYTNFGISKGMEEEIDAALRNKKRIEFRELENWHN